jgi:hypothetical protein
VWPVLSFQARVDKKLAEVKVIEELDRIPKLPPIRI